MDPIQTENRTILVLENSELPDTMPDNILVVKSITEARKILRLREAYVAYRQYIGLKPTGNKPWVVCIHSGDHQVVDSQHQNLQKALQMATGKNSADPNGIAEPETSFQRLFRKLFGQN